MKIWLGVTDNQWFKFLADRNFDEVNFWQPSARALFSNLEPGTPFLFKLKRPYNHIAGGGYFVQFSALPLPIAWEAFGQKNGAQSPDDLDRLIRPLAPDKASPVLDIGCTVLNSPFFWPRHDWIPVPESWSGNIVRGKTYDTADADGNAIWQAVQERIAVQGKLNAVFDQAEVDYQRRYSEPYLSRSRLGQGAFRVLVTEAYKRRCAITGESTLPVLEAAHIRPFSQDGLNRTSNGLLLRSDFHKLFDLGLITVTPELRVMVSSRIKDQWFNGKAYYRLHGQPVAITPDAPQDRPDTESLRWHSQEHFAS